MDEPKPVKTLAAQQSEIVSDGVAVAKNNTMLTFEKLDKALYDLPFELHGSVLEHLNTSYKTRQMAITKAIQERQYQMQVAQEKAMEKAQKDAEAKAAEAKRPRLVGVEAPEPQPVA